MQRGVRVAVRTDGGAQHPFPLQPAQQLQVLRREHRARALAHQQHVARLPPRLLPQRAVPVEQPHILVPLGRTECPLLRFLVPLARTAPGAFLAFTFIRVSALIANDNNVVGFEELICALVKNYSILFGFTAFFE